MLDPQQDRRQLFDALRPPAGYGLDWAVGTTYSVDLLALLTVPLAYTFWGGEDEEGQFTQDPLAQLYGIRQVVDRLAVFCQAGQISVPRKSQRLFTYLEKAIFEVVPPHREGVFHPKLWLLRFTPRPEPERVGEGPIRYRLLCLSRNLTFDQSWDTMLVLDGVYQENRKVAYGRNHPLGDFIDRLPSLAVRPVPPAVKAAIQKMGQEIRKVDFELPDWAADIEFWPMGLTGRRTWPFREKASRQLILSPFITPGFLKQMSAQAQHNILISRLECIEAVAPEALARFKAIYYLDPSAEPEAVEETSNQGGSMALSPKSGLHAKLFISEYSYSTVQLFTGSANATSAAFFQNIEFLVKFTGRGAKIGIDKLLATDKKGDREVRLLDLLHVYEPGQATVEPDPTQERLEQIATHSQRQLARLSLQAVVSTSDQSDNSESALFDVALQIIPGEESEQVQFIPPDNISISCWPISRRREDAVPIQAVQNVLTTMRGLSYAALTAFFAFSITAEAQEQRFTAEFVLNLPLVNAPTDRREQVLRFLLDNRQKVMHYMMFLLAESDLDFPAMGYLLTSQEKLGGNGRLFALPVDLFESMVQALYKEPSKLDQIHSLVTDLEKAGTADLLPEGFADIWPPIWEVRQQLRAQAGGQQTS